jgi:hypothetical protein
MPPSDAGVFFWNETSIQWLDWLFWAATGILLRLSSELAVDSFKPDRSVISLPITVKGYFEEALKGLVVSLTVLWVVANSVDVDALGLKIRLKEAPAVAVGLAFVLGFYHRVAQKLFFKVILQLVKRYVERALGRSIGGKTDDAAYVELHVDPRLQRAYWLAASTRVGRLCHEASRDKRVGYKVSNIVSQAGFTVNALRTVFIAQDLMPLNEDSLVELLAHEASHAEQGFWSDSLEQEVKAFRTGAQVKEELKARGDADHGDTAGWLSLRALEAENRVRDMKLGTRLYGMIPRRQKKAWADKRELVRQGVCLGLEMLGTPGDWCERRE